MLLVMLLCSISSVLEVGLNVTSSVLKNNIGLKKKTIGVLNPLFSVLFFPPIRFLMHDVRFLMHDIIDFFYV